MQEVLSMREVAGSRKKKADQGLADRLFEECIILEDLKSSDHISRIQLEGHHTVFRFRI
jgi:hypothetical protein